MDLILTAPIIRQYFPRALDVAYAYASVQQRMGELVLLAVWRTRVRQSYPTNIQWFYHDISNVVLSLSLSL